jgi:hypothetical protein
MQPTCTALEVSPDRLGAPPWWTALSDDRRASRNDHRIIAALSAPLRSRDLVSMCCVREPHALMTGLMTDGVEI